MGSKRDRNKPAKMPEASPFSPVTQPSTPQHRVTATQRRVASVSHAVIRSGPLPPPEDLAKYNDIIPDGANRILSMAEQQQKHRMYLEKVVIESDSRRAWAGLIAGLVVALALLGAGTYLIATGHETGGTVLVGLDLATVVGSFIYGTRTRQQERATKTQAMKAAD